MANAVWTIAEEQGRDHEKSQPSFPMSKKLRKKFKEERDAVEDFWEHAQAVARQRAEDGIDMRPMQVAALAAAAAHKTERRRKLREMLKEERKKRQERELLRQQMALQASDSRYVWRVINRRLPRRGRQLGLRGSESAMMFKDANGQVSSDHLETLKTAADHFFQLSADVTGNSRSPDKWTRLVGPPPEDLVPHELCDDDLTVDEVNDAVK